MKKNELKSNKIDFKLKTFQLASPVEICQELTKRLSQQRLFKNMKQSDLADRSGISLGTIKNFETKAQVSFENLIRIISALGLNIELECLFQIEAKSISDLEKIENLKNKNIRKRAR